MKYKAKVSKDFIAHRDELAHALSIKEPWQKDFNKFLLRADHEMPEWHTPDFETLKEKYGADAVHDRWKVCDFKHMNKTSGNVSISPYSQRLKFDHFVFWEWVVNPKYTKKLPLEEGDEVTWELIDIVPRNSVINQIINQTQYNYYRHIKWQEKDLNH